MKTFLKKIIGVTFLIICFFVSFNTSAEDIVDDLNTDQGNYQTQEEITGMDIKAIINQDASVLVTETINYDFGNKEKHGIYRTIPLGFRAKGEPKHTEIEIISVTDEENLPYLYEITNNDPVNVKIGNPDQTISGKHTYKIAYKLKHSIGYFDTYDEWYWNLTGNDWEVPINKVSATVVLPNETNFLQFKDYCGIEESTESCGSFLLTDKKTISYQTRDNRIFNSGEEVTIAIGFQKGLISAPTKSELFWAYFVRIWFIPIPFILAFLWFRKKFIYKWKHFKYFNKNTIIAEYDSGIFNPLETSLIVNNEVNNKDISATIIYLAINGYIKIEDKDGEFCFKKIKEISNDLTQSEKLIFDAVEDICEANFGGEQFFKFMNAISQADSRLIARDYCVNGGKSKFSTSFNTKFSYSPIGLPLFLALNPGLFFWILLGNWAGFIFSGTCILVAVINIFLKGISIYLTEKGFEAKRNLLGLKKYIEVAEKDRIEFANAPAKTPELFEKLLPYAMVFGLEKKWAKEFESIYVQNPSWYVGNNVTTFSAIAFASSINSMQMSMNHSIASSIESSSSHSWSSSSGGSSGGGSSGGGGGGGGGGSW